MTRALLLTLAAAACLAQGGCTDDPTNGYTLKSQYPDDVKTVAVPIWNRSRDVYRREIEFDLTEALVKRIELDTPYKVAMRDVADTELVGTIERIDQHVGSFDPDLGVPREMLVTITVSFVWRDLRANHAGNPIRAKDDKLRVTGYYVTEAPVNETFFQGKESVVNTLARRIVEHLEAKW